MIHHEHGEGKNRLFEALDRMLGKKPTEKELGRTASSDSVQTPAQSATELIRDFQSFLAETDPHHPYVRVGQFISQFAPSRYNDVLPNQYGRLHRSATVVVVDPMYPMRECEHHSYLKAVWGLIRSRRTTLR